MAESKGFDLSALIKSVPDLGTDRQQIEYIPIEKIDPDPENFYSLDGLNELAGSIEMLGLQQALLLRPGENGHYTLISGHRRRAAILMIRDGGSDQFKDGVPCVVDRRNASKALWKFQLLMANKDTRKMTSADENRQAEELENVLRELEDAGYEFPGRLRDWVAKLSGMSRSKLGRLKVIREKLAPELRSTYYDTGIWNESVAYTLAQQPVDVQRAMIKDYIACKRPVAELQADHIQAYLADARRSARESAVPKEDMKEKLQREVADYHAELAAEDAAFYKSLTQDEGLFRYIARSIAPGADRKLGIQQLKCDLGNTHSGGSTRHGFYDSDLRGLTLSDDDFEKPISRTWTEVYDIIASRAIFLYQKSQSGASKSLEPAASTGPELNTAPAAWKTGKPPKAGLYAVRFKVSETAPGELHNFMHWDGFQWKAVRSGKIVTDLVAIGWYPLPEV